MKWLKIIGSTLFVGVGLSLSYLFFEIKSLENIIKKDEEIARHEIQKDVYYDKNRATIFEMIEKYKLDKASK